MARNATPTPQQLDRRDALLAQVQAITAFLQKQALAKLYTLRGLGYAALLELGIDDRKEIAAAVGLSPKAIDWGKGKARGSEAQMQELADEFYERVTELAKTLAAGPPTDWSTRP